MKKLLIISAMLGTLVFGQKNNQSSQLASKAIQNGLGTNSFQKQYLDVCLTKGY